MNIISPFLFLRIKRHGNSDGDPVTGALNAGAVGRNCNSEPISGFTACCQCCDWLDVINTMPPVPDHGPAGCDTYRW